MIPAATAVLRFVFGIVCLESSAQAAGLRVAFVLWLMAAGANPSHTTASHLWPLDGSHFYRRIL